MDRHTVVFITPEPDMRKTLYRNGRQEPLRFWALCAHTAESDLGLLGYELRPMYMTLDGTYAVVTGAFTVRP